MSVGEDSRLQQMLADETYALSQWYTHFNRPAEEGLIPVGPVPDPSRILRLFTDWVEVNKDKIRQAICPRWKSLKELPKELGVAAVVIGLTRCLEQCQLGMCDITATAVILYTKWNIDGLCVGCEADEVRGHP